MNRVELYSLLTITITICLGGYANADAGAGAAGSSWGCDGPVSWVDVIIMTANGLTILWMLMLLATGGKSKLIGYGKHLSILLPRRSRGPRASDVFALEENPVSRPGSIIGMSLPTQDGDVEMMEPSELARSTINSVIIDIEGVEPDIQPQVLTGAELDQLHQQAAHTGTGRQQRQGSSAILR